MAHQVVASAGTLITTRRSRISLGSSPTGSPSASTQAWALNGSNETPVHQSGQAPRRRQSSAVATERSRQRGPVQRWLDPTTSDRALAASACEAGCAPLRRNSSTVLKRKGFSRIRSLAEFAAAWASTQFAAEGRGADSSVIILGLMVDQLCLSSRFN